MTPSALAVGPFADTYPTAHVRGRRISRWEEASFGWTTLDAALAEELGREQLGWFAGGHPGVERAVGQLGRLDALPGGGVWVAVPYSREASAQVWGQWPHRSFLSRMPDQSDASWWSRRVWVASPEDLRRLLPDVRAQPAGVAGVIVLDPDCGLYAARGGTNARGEVWRNDRPQWVVDFRTAVARGDWQPPLLLLTERPAKAVNTDAVARAFCLQGFQFIAGSSFACWEEPITDD